MKFRSSLLVSTVAVASAASPPMEVMIHEDKPFQESLSSAPCIYRTSAEGWLQRADGGDADGKDRLGAGR